MGLDIQSKEVIDKVSDELKVQPALQIPRQLGDKIQLVYNVNPIRTPTIFKSMTINAPDTSAIIFTTPSTQDFFLTYAEITTAVAETSSISAFINGEEIFITRNISNNTISSYQGLPIRIDRGTEIKIVSAGGQTHISVIHGYITDPQ